MRSYVPAYEMETPRNLDEALERMAREPGTWKPFAGGTDLMVLLEAGKLAHHKFLNIWKLQELRGINVTSSHVTLGALTTYSEVRRNEMLTREFPLLNRAAAETGSVATQNRGTLGGNIANASPAADSPPALLVYNTELELVSSKGSRWVPYHGFWTGYKKTGLRDEELIRAIRIERRETNDWRHFYRKVGTRRAQAISKVCLAGIARVSSGQIMEARIALGSVAPTVLRGIKTEQLLIGTKPTRDVVEAAQRVLAHEIAPIDDIRSTSKYRMVVAQNLLEEFCITVTT
jgi:CO/xanthine dehydrogenase FAD-binding subunit